MVTSGFSAPRTWSVLLSGAKREGVSDPGVGTLMAVQTGGVGIIRLGMAGDVLIGGARRWEAGGKEGRRERGKKRVCASEI